MTTDPALTDETGTGSRAAVNEPAAVHLTKVYGAGRAYLLHCDLDGDTRLSSEQARAATDPVRGIGATALIRIVPADVVGRAGARWFVEATAPTGRPAVISSGVLRAAAAYLHAREEVTAGDGDTITLLSEAGRHYVTYSGGRFSLTVGSWRAVGGRKTLDEGFNATVAVGGLSDPRPGLQLDVGATHTIVALETESELAELNFVVPPRVEPATDGTGSLVFVVPLGERDVDLTGADGEVIGTERNGAAQVRVVTGSGPELLADDYAAAAATVAVRNWLGEDAAAEWVVLSPGGSQRVTVRASRSIEVAETITVAAEITWFPPAGGFGG